MQIELSDACLFHCYLAIIQSVINTVGTNYLEFLKAQCFPCKILVGVERKQWITPTEAMSETFISFLALHN